MICNLKKLRNRCDLFTVRYQDMLPGALASRRKKVNMCKTALEESLLNKKKNLLQD